jgi:hypothetical protein
MRRFCFIVLSIFILVILARATPTADQTAAPLQVGDTFPVFSGKTLTGRYVIFPAPASRQPTVAVFSFSRAAAGDARQWNRYLSEEFSSKLPMYGVILLEDAPKLFRSMAVAGIKNSMPRSVQDRTIVSYRGENLWKQRLHVSDNRRAYVVVIGPRGRIRSMNSGRFTDAEYTRLKDKISSSFSPQL